MSAAAEPQVYFWVPSDAAVHRGKTLPGASRAASPPNLSLPKQGAGTHPCTKRPRMKTLLRTGARQRRAAHPPRSHDNSLFTLQTTWPAPACERAIACFSEPRAMMRTVAPAVAPAVVEVNGFEPMTSCLQSRRSPS